MWKNGPKKEYAKNVLYSYDHSLLMWIMVFIFCQNDEILCPRFGCVLDWLIYHRNIVFRFLKIEFFSKKLRFFQLNVIFFVNLRCLFVFKFTSNLNWNSHKWAFSLGECSIKIIKNNVSFLTNLNSKNCTAWHFLLP